MTGPTDLPAKIIELEVHLAHLQRLYEQLNEVVTAQALEADRMRRRILELESQLKQLKEKPAPMLDPLDEKPPHY